jgi:hypothetical protein
VPDYTIRTFKAWRSRDIERAWSNTYEIMTALGSVTSLETIAADIVAAERVLHMKDVQFLQYAISTWVPDSKPYDPDTFVTVGLTGTGARGATGINPTALDYNVCLIVKREAATGRVGRLYYRGCLIESDVEMGGDGRFIMTPDPGPESVTSMITGAYNTELSPYITGEPGNNLALVGKSGTVVHRRPVVRLTFGGIGVNKKNHRYFDRAPGA